MTTACLVIAKMEQKLCYYIESKKSSRQVGRYQCGDFTRKYSTRKNSKFFKPPSTRSENSLKKLFRLDSYLKVEYRVLLEYTRVLLEYSRVYSGNTRILLVVAKLDPLELENQSSFEYSTRNILESRVLVRAYPGFELKVPTLHSSCFELVGF